MKTLVTGGLGFIGSNLVDLLVKEGHQVSVIDNLSSDSSSISYRNSKSEISISGIRRSSFMRERYDLIFHLAAKARIQPSFDQPFDYIYENTINSLRLFQKAADDKSRIVFASTSSSQGGKFTSPYTFSKVSSEELLSMYNQTYGMRGTTVRFFNVYGPREPEKGSSPTVVAKFLQSYRKGEPLTVIGDGTQMRDFTHVNDICEGLIRIANREAWEIDMETEGRGIDLGRGEPLSINDLVKIFYPNPQEGRDFVCEPLRRNEPLKTEADPATLKRILDWTPSMNLSEYIDKQKQHNGNI
jgi:nucleoside-diphosphate-sugar epimerase